DTGDGGIWVWGYTAQLGGGFTAPLSAEGRRASQIVGASGALGALSAGALTGDPASAYGGYGGWQVPDIVGNLRVDQAWGGAQIMGALHEDNGLYYGTTPLTGHPSDAWGWVIGAGLKINTPFISQGDYLDAEANYTQGALKYLWDANPSNEQGVNGATEGFGIMSDCVYGGTVGAGATGCQLTSAWEIDVGYEHYWTPQWHESFVFNGMWTKYGTSGNNMLCSAEGAGNGLAGSAAVALAGCNNNWDDYGGGSRLQ
ncbi:MAG: porin, partial [Xanthobacteraceae bacterium]